MKKRIVACLMMVACLAVWGVFPAVAAEKQGKTYKFRLQCAYPESAFVGQNTLFFAQRVKELTDGKVDIKVFWPGQLVKTNETFDAVSKGMIDIYSGSLLYFAGYVPEVNCEWLPFGWSDAKEALELYRDHGWLDLMREGLDKHGTYYVAPLSVASMGLITKFPVHQLSDLKGKAIRGAGMDGRVIDVLGGSPVGLAGAEQYMALHRGTVDGTVYPFYTIDNYKFYEVSKYIVRPAIHTPGIVEIVFNKRKYQSLPEEYRAAIDKAGWEAFLKTVEGTPSWDGDAYEVCREKGIEIIDLSPEVVADFRKATLPLWNEIATKSPTSAKLVESLKAYLSQKGIQME
ncbi:TRAP transporter substrate-binding protein DctP [Desulfosarcina sp. OttesenSCG-928-A07]|nr:TRAP transporter substrate-binding protein DctP [Desulfosarcina sp. OttesenSCG-928-G17]MDL2329258.1 TRAP transporter substrate-binding protein DctP [Desulfosarcina sp. OttesenSCG-928-A07]